MPIDPTLAVTMHTVLAVDAMYFNAARSALVRAQKAELRLRSARIRHERWTERYDEVSNRSGEGSRDQERLYAMSLRLYDEDARFGEAHGPLVKECAVVHILSATALEAHLNIRARQALSHKKWKTFEHHPLRFKAEQIAHVCNIEPFDPGAEPMSRIVDLIALRDALVHYKPQQEPWAPPGIPAFLPDLGLNLDAAKRSIKAVGSMIGAVARRRGEAAPYWLSVDGGSFFDVV